MPLSSLYLDATWYNVTPACPERKRLGVSFDIAGAATLRLALTLADAQMLSNFLAGFINNYRAFGGLELQERRVGLADRRLVQQPFSGPEKRVATVPRRAVDRERLGLDIGSAGQGV